MSVERNRKHVPQHLKAEKPRLPAAAEARRAEREKPRRAGSAPDPKRAVSPGVSRSTILYEETLLPTVENVHRIDRSGLRVGLAWLAVLPVLLLVIRRLTDSSKVAFLIIWIIGMFIISSALIFIAYTDHELKRFLNAVKERVPAASDTTLDEIGLASSLEDLELPVAPERLRALLARRHGRSAAQNDSAEESADLRKLEEWLRRLEQRGEKRDHDA